MKYQAVLFDYDGVTADTPPLNYQAWAYAFRSHGVKIAAEEYFLLEGHGPLKVAQALCNAHALDLKLAESLKMEKEAHMRTLRSAVIYPEIPGLLITLAEQGIKLGLVTGAARARIDYSLPEEVRAFYGVIITSDDVKNTKPHPEPYLKASRALSSDPKLTLVVENAVLGIRSAKAGGFDCVALSTTLVTEHLHEADIVFENHSQLSNWLGKK